MVTLVKDTNSYVSLSEATAYFANRLDVAAWDEADDDNKSKALITATSILDNLNWEGYAVSETQALAFPRVVQYFDPRLGRSTINDGSSTPGRVLTATFELAYHLLNNDGLLDNTGSVTDLQIGPITLKEVKNASVIPSVVNRLIKPLLANSGAISVWRAW